MGYDTSIIIGPHVDLAGWNDQETDLPFDDVVNRQRAQRVLALGRGPGMQVLVDPHRLLGAQAHKRLAGGRSCVVLDLVQRTDVYTVKLMGERPTRTITYRPGGLQESSGKPWPEEKHVRLGSLPETLYHYADALGYRDSFLDWPFTVLTAQARGSVISTQREFFGPSIMRMLVVQGAAPAAVLGALSRYASLYQQPPLGLAACLSGLMSAAHIAVAGNDEVTVLFDESGSLTLDLAWLPAASSRVARWPCGVRWRRRPSCAIPALAPA